MKRLIYISIFLSLVFSSCVKDDFCIEDTTPKLIIRFYDQDDHSATKTVSGLYVWAQGKDTIYSNQTLDSIALPLNPNEDITSYHFSSNSLVDQLDISYQRDFVFVSRSCGYKIVYHPLSVDQLTNNWIHHLTLNNETIDHEATAHIAMYH